MATLTPQTKKELLFTMLKIRRFEEKITDLYPEQQMKTPVHLCIGQEASAAGVCAHLTKDDYIFSTHRNHGHFIAKGIDVKPFMAELYGKAAGCSRGKGGSMHIVSLPEGIFGASAIVGAGMALGVGAALAIKMKKEKRVTVTFFGDGAVDEGTFHESLNFASLKKLAVVFVCENNFYATNSPQSARQSQDNISLRAGGYGMPGVQLDGNDVESIYRAAGQAIEAARSGKGPALIECRTYRWRGHVGPECDYEKGCRSKEELAEWMEKCPIAGYKEELLKNKVITPAEYETRMQEIDRQINAAVAFAKESPFPDAGEIFRDVYYGTV
ncbi:MAG TPA: thiamine pyrophosphate-dependent dehydrogenase E1 component subunit alpha [Patescibacteria group bacterium]|nr:thiamine pyrophosphate-dependent dehydrogenase E1 component subunit alpha [Patescibacteria group bacterium]